jgi:hypothetical protein
MEPTLNPKTGKRPSQENKDEDENRNKKKRTIIQEDKEVLFVN